MADKNITDPEKAAQIAERFRVKRHYEQSPIESFGGLLGDLAYWLTRLFRR